MGPALTLTCFQVLKGVEQSKCQYATENGLVEGLGDLSGCSSPPPSGMEQSSNFRADVGGPVGSEIWSNSACALDYEGARAFLLKCRVWPRQILLSQH